MPHYEIMNKIIRDAARGEGGFRMDLHKGREKASWDEALEMLLDQGFIKTTSEQRYELTSKGWNKSDQIESGGGFGRLTPEQKRALNVINNPDRNEIV